MRLVSKGNVICREHKEVISRQTFSLSEHGCGLPKGIRYQMLSPEVWGWVAADLVLFPCYSLNPTFLSDLREHKKENKRK